MVELIWHGGLTSRNLVGKFTTCYLGTKKRLIQFAKELIVLFVVFCLV